MVSAELLHGYDRLVQRLGDRDVAAKRERSAQSVTPEPPAGCRVEPAVLGGVPCEWVWADDAAHRVVLTMHHGGYVAGAAWMLRPLEVDLSRRCGARFLGVDYRLAPEHAVPAQVDDVVCAYRALLDEGWPPRHVAFGGASAGGGLAIAGLIRCRRLGLPLPAGAFAVSPWLDMTLSSPSMTEADSADRLSTLQEFRQLSSAVLAGRDARDPLVSPLFADLGGLPPVHLEVGTAERLRDDARNFAETARSTGVDVTIAEVDAAPHCFPIHIPDAPESIEARARIAGRLSAWLDLAGPK